MWGEMSIERVQKFRSTMWKFRKRRIDVRRKGQEEQEGLSNRFGRKRNITSSMAGERTMGMTTFRCVPDQIGGVAL